MDVGIPNRLRKPFDKIIQANRCHKQNDHRLRYQRAQHHPLNDHCHHDHDCQCDGNGEPEINAHLENSNKRQCREQHHGTLGKIKDP